MPKEKAKREKYRFSVQLDADLAEGLRDAAYFTRLTLNGIVQEGLRRELKRLQRRHNDGKPFPQRGSELKGGRPISMP